MYRNRFKINYPTSFMPNNNSVLDIINHMIRPRNPRGQANKTRSLNEGGEYLSIAYTGRASWV